MQEKEVCFELLEGSMRIELGEWNELKFWNGCLGSIGFMVWVDKKPRMGNCGLHSFLTKDIIIYVSYRLRLGVLSMMIPGREITR